MPGDHVLAFPGVVPEIRTRFERELSDAIELAAIKSKGNVAEMARELGCRRTTLVMYLRDKKALLNFVNSQRKEAP